MKCTGPIASACIAFICVCVSVYMCMIWGIVCGVYISCMHGIMYIYIYIYIYIYDILYCNYVYA